MKHECTTAQAHNTVHILCIQFFDDNGDGDDDNDTNMCMYLRNCQVESLKRMVYWRKNVVHQNKFSCVFDEIESKLLLHVIRH